MKTQEKSSLSYWIKFFPEVRNEKELHQLLKSVHYWTPEAEGIWEKSLSCSKEDLLNKAISPELNRIMSVLAEENPFYATFGILVNRFYDKTDFAAYEEGFTDSFGAKVQFVKSLCEELLIRALRTLIGEINIARVAGILIGKTSEERFKYYINQLWNNPEYIDYYYKEHQQLFCLLTHMIEQRVAYHNQILSRLNKDKIQIAEKLFGTSQLGKIVTIDYSKGDAHRDGKNVIILEFEGKRKIVYKPRSLQLEVGFGKLLTWMNEQLGSQLHILGIIDCKDYGYLEFIDYGICHSKEEVAEYYVNIGRILCAVYWLNGKDLHHENIIVKGISPVIVDLDALFHSNINIGQKIGSDSYTKALQKLNHSVYATGILPHMLNNPKDMSMKGIDISGLQGDRPQTAPFKVYKLVNRNTDEIRMEETTFEIKPFDNIPMYKGKRITAGGYVQQIITGFAQTYTLGMKYKQKLTDMINLNFQGARTRMIVRPTYLYGKLINTSQHPQFMTSKETRITFLSKLAYDVPRVQLEIVRSEIRDILVGDIPLFEAGVTDNHIYDSRSKMLQISQYGIPFSYTAQKIGELSEDGMKEQIDIIVNAFKCESIESYRRECQTRTEFSMDTYPDESNCLKVAKQIGDWIIEDSIVGIGESGVKNRSWLGYSSTGTEEIRFEYDILHSDIYNGNAGMALFLLYLGQLTGEDKYIRASVEAMMNLVERVDEWDSNVRNMLVGPYNGLSGYLFVLFEIYNYIREEYLLSVIRLMMKNIDENIPNDKNYDFLSGCAGAIMVVKRIHDKTDDITLKADSAKMIKRMLIHIMEHKEVIGNRMCAWISADGGTRYSGFAHGTAGISIALLKAAEFYDSPDEIYQTITQALAYENGLLDLSEHNWRTSDRLNGYSIGWCHGAPGILLNRMILYENGICDQNIERDLAISSKKVREKGIAHNICYCHGDLGNLEILYLYAQKNSDEKLMKECFGAYKAILAQTDQYLCKGTTQPKGLMIGTVGIGYMALRLINRDIPSILRLE